MGYPFAVDDSVVTVLGAATLRDLAGNLWFQDCQTCGRELGAAAALVVDDIGPFAAAALHHSGCRTSSWSDDGIVRMSSGMNLSYRTIGCLIPAEADGKRSDLPVMVVNPSLEQVMLRRKGDRWKVATVEHYRECGLTGIRANRPVANTTARIISPEVLTITLDITTETWEFPCNSPGLVEQIRALRGVALGVTTAHHPHHMLQMNAGRFAEALNSDAVATGWIPLAG